MVDLVIERGRRVGLSGIPRGYKRLDCAAVDPPLRDEVTVWVTQRVGGVYRPGSEGGSAEVREFWLVPYDALGL